MHNTLIILGLVLIIGICLAIYKHNHHRNLHDNVEQLNAVLQSIFAEDGKDVISQNRLIRGLKEHMGVSEKVAYHLIGKARKEHLLTIDESGVRLAK